MAQDERSNGEARLVAAEEFRRFLKTQRARVERKLTAMARRIGEARLEPLDEFEARVQRRTGWKKPTLEHYDARWR